MRGVDVDLPLLRARAGETPEGLKPLELAHPVRADAYPVHAVPALPAETRRGERPLFDAHEPRVGRRQAGPPRLVGGHELRLQRQDGAAVRGAGRTDGGDQLTRHGTDDPRRPRGCLRDTHVPTLDRLAVEPGEELAAVREPLLRRAERRHPGDDRVTRPVVEGRSEETRLNSSHSSISYAVFCLKKKIH